MRRVLAGHPRFPLFRAAEAQPVVLVDDSGDHGDLFPANPATATSMQGRASIGDVPRPAGLSGHPASGRKPDPDTARGYLEAVDYFLELAGMVLSGTVRGDRVPSWNACTPGLWAALPSDRRRPARLSLDELLAEHYPNLEKISIDYRRHRKGRGRVSSLVESGFRLGRCRRCRRWPATTWPTRPGTSSWVGPSWRGDGLSGNHRLMPRRAPLGRPARGEGPDSLRVETADATFVLPQG